MFDQLQTKILEGVRKLRGQNKISEENIQEILKEIRLALLEADVHFKVVKVFLDRVKDRALGAEVLTGVRPGEQFVKIVHDELVRILGGGSQELDLKARPTVIFLVGLQGAGKTTTAAKLALHLRKKLNRRPGLVPVDVYRPAAIEQLQILAKQNDLPCFPSVASDGPEAILEKAKVWAASQNIEVVLVDTAGRLQIDDSLMGELVRLKSVWSPQETLLVADATLGQQSVNVADGFHQKLGLTGLILTKVDGDARGGAALSIREATGVGIKFLGLGEKVDALEVFHPDRLASRILDMGDVVSLVEKAQEVITEKDAMQSASKMMKGQFTFEDFLAQLQQLKKLGGMEGLLKMLPGMGQAMKQMKDMAPPDKEMRKIEAIIRSMTHEERNNHKILNGSRRLRIAKGSGTQVSDVNQLVKRFEDSKKAIQGMMKMMGPMGRGFPGGFPGMRNR